LIVYRIARRRYVANDGEGAKRHGGRWNRKGTAIVYASQSLALSLLEVVANSFRVPMGLVAIEIEIPDDVSIHDLTASELPRAWASKIVSDRTRNIGTEWVHSGETAILSVPSSIIPRERNFLLNPAHKDFARIKFQPPEPFRLDPRLK
jgi:RES domain-containing protein